MKKLALFSALFMASVLTFEAQALQMLKCNSATGKTLYATFGKRTNSDGVVYFPIEFAIFRSPTELQERIIYASTKDSLKIPLKVSPTAISFIVPSPTIDGLVEALDLQIYSPQNANAFKGTWTTQDSTGTKSAPLACSVF